MRTMRKNIVLLLLAALLLSGCAAGNPFIRVREKPDPAESAAPEPTEESLSTPAPSPEPTAELLCVVIDPGHQRTGDASPEPVGPGASEQKARVTGGTTGRFTGIPEYECNLAVSLRLREVLVSRGYRVVMTREDHDVNLSNRERAEIAAQAGADVFVRVHANGSEDPARHGAMTICMTRDNPYHPELYAAGCRLAECVLDAMTARAGCERERVWETDTMSGINWAEMPCIIVELGYMTNEEEDRNLADDACRQLLAEGIADGIDRYFAEKQADEA